MKFWNLGASFEINIFRLINITFDEKMSLTFGDMTRRAVVVLNFRLRASVSSVFNCHAMRTGSQLRHGYPISIVLDSLQICFHGKVILNVTVGFQDWITVNVLNLFRPYIDNSFRDNRPFTFRFEFRRWTINIKKICIDKFANISNPCREDLLMEFSQLIIHLFDIIIIIIIMKTIDIAHSRHTAVYTRCGEIQHFP